MYIAIGIDLDGRKDVLGMWGGENESTKFWATVLNGLRNREVEAVFVACRDNLTVFDAAIHAAAPKTEIRNCIIHQLRNASKYMPYKDLEPLMANRKEATPLWMSRPVLDALDAWQSDGVRHLPRSPNPGGTIGPTRVPILSVCRRCCG